MKETTRTFTYTAMRGTYITSACAFILLLLIDGGLLGLLVFLFIHNSLLRLVVPGIETVIYLLLIVVLLAPLWTKHRLSATHLQLHYGLSLNITIPRSTIIAAQAVRERLTMLEPMWARYDANKNRIVSAFSATGQVLLHLDGTHSYKVGRSTVLADTILLNVDACDEFLADLIPVADSMLDNLPHPRSAIHRGPTINRDTCPPDRMPTDAVSLRSPIVDAAPPLSTLAAPLCYSSRTGR